MAFQAIQRALEIEAQAERARIMANARLRQLEQLENARKLGAMTEEAFEMAKRLVIRTTVVENASGMNSVAKSGEVDARSIDPAHAPVSIFVCIGGKFT